MKLEAVYPTLEHQNAADAIVEILDLPELYEQLTHLLEIRQFESQELPKRGKKWKNYLRSMHLLLYKDLERKRFML